MNAVNLVVIESRVNQFGMKVPVYHTDEHFSSYMFCHAQRLQKTNIYSIESIFMSSIKHTLLY